MKRAAITTRRTNNSRANNNSNVAIRNNSDATRFLEVTKFIIRIIVCSFAIFSLLLMLLEDEEIAVVMANTPAIILACSCGGITLGFIVGTFYGILKMKAIQEQKLRNEAKARHERKKADVSERRSDEQRTRDSFNRIMRCSHDFDYGDQPTAKTFDETPALQEKPFDGTPDNALKSFEDAFEDTTEIPDPFNS